MRGVGRGGRGAGCRVRGAGRRARGAGCGRLLPDARKRLVGGLRGSDLLLGARGVLELEGELRQRRGYQAHLADRQLDVALRARVDSCLHELAAHLGGQRRGNERLRPGRTAAPQRPVGPWTAQRLVPSGQRSHAPGRPVPGGQDSELRRDQEATVKATFNTRGGTSMIDSTLRPASHESISFDWRGVSLSLKKHACTV